MLSIVATCGAEVRRMALPETDALLGSSSGADVYLPYPGISRRHARIERVDGRPRLVDLGSKNGLVVDGRRCESVELREGVRVDLGRATIVIAEAGSSDLKPALATGASGERRSSTGRSTGAAPDPSRNAASALRLLCELEARGPHAARHRSWLVARARETLAAETVAHVRRLDTDVAVVELAGPLPERETLAACSSRLRSRPQASGFELRRLAAGWAAVAWAAGGSAGAAPPDPARAPEPVVAELIVLYGKGARPPDWHRDLLSLVLAKLVRSPAAAVAEPVSAPSALSLPPGMLAGGSQGMKRLLARAAVAARSEMNVLVVGETGTGKELIARALHDSGARKRGPFLPINCAAIPAELLEAEMFGVGARIATGVDVRAGHFEEADGGTVFLDEIGEMPPAMQAKLLRVLETREVVRLGLSHARKVDVRVISASNRNLARAVREGGFRADLYYRLRGMELQIPALRDRRDDIPGLVLAFVAATAEGSGKRVCGVSRKALELLHGAEWPGNVRQLRQAVEQAVHLCPDGGVVQTDHFDDLGSSATDPEAMQPDPDPPREILEPVAPGPRGGLSLRHRVAELEQAAIEEALRKTRGNVSLAAKLLGISRNTLSDKLRRLRR